MNEIKTSRFTVPNTLQKQINQRPLQRDSVETVI